MADARLRFFMIAFVGALALVVWTLPQWWATVNPESSVAACLEGVPLDICAQYANLPRGDREAFLTISEGEPDTELPAKPQWAAALVTARLNTENTSAPEATELFEPPTGAQVVSQGEFTGVDNVRFARGGFMIYQQPTGERLLRIEEDFLTSRAPDIHLVFTRNPDPNDISGVGIDYLDVGTLKGNEGAQNYDVPQGIDFSRYPVLVLYSPSYDAVLGTASLQ